MTQPYYDIKVPDRIMQDVRVYYGDVPEFNRLLEGTEVSDEKLKLALQLWVKHFNSSPPILEQKFGVEDFRDPLIMFQGVVIELLKMSGLIYSRNFLNFNDNGVSFTVNDKASDYMQWIQNFLQTHAQDVKDLKVALNAESAYDFYESPEALFPDIF